jgi:hypothetical protein
MKKRTESRIAQIKWVRAYLMRVRDPIIADRSLDLMCAAFWMFLSIWGLTSMFTGIETISGATNDWYRNAWGGAIGILCLTAFTSAIATFFNNPNIGHRINLKRTEMLAGSLAGGFISVYPALILLAVLGGDWARFAPFWATLVYLVIPTWRVRHLYHRIAKLRQIQEDIAARAEP